MDLIEHVQRRNGRSISQLAPSKGFTMLSLLVILAVVSVGAIISSIVVTTRDGYGRQPRETFARTV